MSSQIAASKRGIIQRVAGRLTYLFRYAVLYPQWLCYRLQHQSQVSTPEISATEVERILSQKEEAIRRVVERSSTGSFLEIGIGVYPNIPRMKLMKSCQVRYTGCDQGSVCRLHEEVLSREGFAKETTRFLGNEVGNYCLTLFELLQQGERFDTIFLDGHHTFYVDLGALFLADQLLKPNGLLIVDDTRWSLEFVKENMQRSFGEWCFYHSIYDFSEYSAEQQSVPYIGLLVDEIAVKRLSYKVLDELSSNEWAVLQKGAGAAL